jgi:type II secretory pathway component GspD/PulD (secretin)
MRLLLITAVLVAATAVVVLAQEEEIFKNYNLRHIKLSDPEVRRKVESELRKITGPKSHFSLDERANQIFVRGSQAYQDEVEKVLSKLVVGKKEDTSKVTATVRVANVEASVAKKALEEAMKKDAKLAGLKINYSDDTGTVVLTGTAAQLQKAKKIIEALEEKFRSEVETKVYRIRNRSAKSLAEIVKLHLAGSPGTGVAVDEVTNSLVVVETRANQAKVKEVVSKFDTELATIFLKFRVIYASREGRGVDESVKDVQEGGWSRVTARSLRTAAAG